LAIDRDGLARGELGEIDAMPPSLEADVKALVTQAAALQACVHTHRLEEVDGPLLEDAGPHAIDHVVAAAVFDDDGIDTVDVEKMAQQESRWARADDSDLRPLHGHAYLALSAALPTRRIAANSVCLRRCMSILRAA
jgi:hypothetical protein